MKKKYFILMLSGILLLSSMTGCVSRIQKKTGDVSDLTLETTLSQTVNLSTVPDAEFSDEDTDSSWDESTATKIMLNGSAVSTDGSGAEVSGNVVTITDSGVYVISGILAGGQIVISATQDDTVKLVLNGADITNKSGAPIYAAQCDKLIITLAEGTQNTVTDGGDNFTYSNTTDEEPNAAVFCKDDLRINGTGMLTVNAGFNNGIGTKDDLLITNGNLTVNAANHGIRGNDSVTILDGNFKIPAGNDGIQTSNNQDADKGWINIEGGVFDITSAHDAIQAETAVNISGGELNITAGGGVSKSETIASSYTISDSFKGIKSSGDINFSGGSITVDSADDAIHSNGSISISGGEFTLSTGDDGIHADNDLMISNGTVTVTQSYEGLEAANVTISGGIVNITASDDGINAAGGGSQDTGEGRFGGDKFASGGNYSINIRGGTIINKSGGDGLDSNGDINISGGNIISLINSTPDNEAIDGDGAVTFTGGTIIYGGTGTGAGLNENSTQSYVYISSGVATGSEISVKKNGSTLVSFTPEINCQYLAASSPDITSGESYEIYSGSSLIATATAGTGGSMGGGGMGGGRGNPGQRPGSGF